MNGKEALTCAASECFENGKKKTNLRESSCKLRDGTLRNSSPLITAVFTKGEVVWWFCFLLTPHDAPEVWTDG